MTPEVSTGETVAQAWSLAVARRPEQRRSPLAHGSSRESAVVGAPGPQRPLFCPMLRGSFPSARTRQIPMADLNPYAPPSPETDAEAPRPGKSGKKRKRKANGTNCWQENGQVVILKDGGELPDRCVVCNKPTDYKLRKTFSWHNPGLYLLVLAGWLIYVIVAAVVRKTGTVNLGLCDEHRVRRKNGLVVLWVGLAAGLLMVLVGATNDSPVAMLVGLAALTGSLIAGGIMSRVASPTKIDVDHVRLKAGAPFVASLPHADD